MFTIISLMFCGMAAGYLCRRKPLGWLGHVITALIWLLLLVLGLEVGANRRIMDNLVSLGGESLLVAAMCTLGSLIAAKLLWHWVNGGAKGQPSAEADEPSAQSEGSLAALKGSLVIVLFFAVGVAASYSGLVQAHVAGSDLGFYALGALMMAVGVSIGSDTAMLQRFRSLNKRLALLPLCTIAGTMLGSVVVSIVLQHRGLTDCLALGAGMGYYSLSSIFITEYRGAELGTVALLANILRELITLLLAPWLVRYFGRLAAIAAGGATTMDTTLPVILRVSGKEMLIVSVFHGFVTDFSVPFMVTLWCSL